MSSASAPTASVPPSAVPFAPYEVMLRNHAILCSIAWLILLPLGAVFARLLRSFTRVWFWFHLTFQFLIAGPIFYAGWQRGFYIARDEFNDTHKRIGLAMLILYSLNVGGGLFIHFVKLPIRWPGGRSPVHYLHGVIGLALLALGSFQVHYGLYIEWPQKTGNIHPVPKSAKTAWLALVITFWTLYGFGLIFLPRQLKLEAAARKQMHKEIRNDA